jgi:hypothetical protein
MVPYLSMCQHLLLLILQELINHLREDHLPTSLPRVLLEDTHLQVDHQATSLSLPQVLQPISLRDLQLTSLRDLLPASLLLPSLPPMILTVAWEAP